MSTLDTRDVARYTLQLGGHSDFPKEKVAGESAHENCSDISGWNASSRSDDAAVLVFRTVCL